MADEDPRREPILLLASRVSAVGQIKGNIELRDIGEAIYHLLSNSNDVIMMDANRDTYYSVLRKAGYSDEQIRSLELFEGYEPRKVV